MNSEAFQYSGSGSNAFPLQQAVLNYTRTVSPTLLNNLRVGMNYFPDFPAGRRSICPACHSPVRDWADS